MKQIVNDFKAGDKVEITLGPGKGTPAVVISDEEAIKYITSWPEEHRKIYVPIIKENGTYGAYKPCHLIKSSIPQCNHEFISIFTSIMCKHCGKEKE